MSYFSFKRLFRLFNVHDGMSQILAEGSVVMAGQSQTGKHDGPEFQCHLLTTKFSIESLKSIL